MRDEELAGQRYWRMPDRLAKAAVEAHRYLNKNSEEVHNHAIQPSE